MVREAHRGFFINYLWCSVFTLLVLIWTCFWHSLTNKCGIKKNPFFHDDEVSYKKNVNFPYYYMHINAAGDIFFLFCATPLQSHGTVCFNRHLPSNIAFQKRTPEVWEISTSYLVNILIPVRTRHLVKLSIWYLAVIICSDILKQYVTIFFVSRALTVTGGICF